MKARLVKLQADVEKTNKLAAKQETILKRDGKTVEDADAAFTEWASTQDAAKAIEDEPEATDAE